MSNTRKIPSCFIVAIMILSAGKACAQDPADEHIALINRRVSVSYPTQTLEVATPYALPLTLSGPSVESASVSWSYFDSTIGDFGPPTDATAVSVQYHKDGYAYVNMVPTQIGKAKAYLNVDFSDGETAVQVIPANIKLAVRAPIKFTAALRLGNEIQNIRIDVLDFDRYKRDFVRSYATYSGLKSAVRIPASDVTYTILPAPGAPSPIQVDPESGKIDSLQVGHAVLETTFNGLTSRNCVIVQQSADTAAQSDCLDIMGKDVFNAEGDTAPHVKPAGRPTPPKQ
jgi:hypothetical protein